MTKDINLDIEVSKTDPSKNFYKWIDKPESGKYLVTVYLSKEHYSAKDLPEALNVRINDV